MTPHHLDNGLNLKNLLKNLRHEIDFSKKIAEFEGLKLDDLLDDIVKLTEELVNELMVLDTAPQI